MGFVGVVVVVGYVGFAFNSFLLSLLSLLLLLLSENSSTYFRTLDTLSKTHFLLFYQVKNPA